MEMKQNTTPLSDSENLDASIHGVEEKLSSSKSTMIYDTCFYPEDISIGYPFLTPIFINILRWRRVSFLFKLHVLS